MAQFLWKTVWQFLRRLNIELPYDLAIPLWKQEFKYLYSNIHCSIICQKVETTIVNRWMDKNNVIYTYSGILFSHQRMKLLYML